MTAGERVRFWIDATKMQRAASPCRHARRARSVTRSRCCRSRRRAEPPPVPPDVAKPPADAKKTPRGVFYKVLKAGKGGREADAERHGQVNYTGWTTDGQMFDSSVITTQPAEFCLQRRDRGLDRRHHADVGRRQVPVLDPRGARVQGPAGPAAGHARVRRRAARDQGRGRIRTGRTASVIETVAPSPRVGLARRIRSSRSPVASSTRRSSCARWRTPIAVLQQLHPVSAPTVNLDLEAVTSHLAARGLVTPRLIRTLDGHAWVEHDGRGVARADLGRRRDRARGADRRRGPRPAARSSAAFIARSPICTTTIASRAPACTTPRRISASCAIAVEAGGDAEAVELGREILARLPRCPALPAQRAASRAWRFQDLEPAVSHAAHSRASRSSISTRSASARWRSSSATRCGRGATRTEKTRAIVQFELPIFAAAIAGFRSEADDLVTRDEKIAIVIGLETVCIELAARFAVDVFEDRYFGWDPTRFPSRREHNLVRARGQLALGRQVAAARPDLLDLVLAGS